MMRYIRYVFGLLATMFLAAACECEEFEIFIPTTPKLVLLCCPGAADTTVIQLYKTVPVGNTYSGSPFLDEATFDFTVNGKVLNVKHAIDRTGSVPEGCWFVPQGFEAGDKVEIRVSAKGAESITASTVLPMEAPDFKYTFKENYPDDYNNLTISFTDDSASNDWYGVAVECERTKIEDGVTTVEYSLLAPKKEETGLNGVAIDREYLDIRFTGWSFGSWSYPIRVWQDSAFNQKEIDLSLLLDYGYFSWENGDYELSMRYRVRLYRFSREFFRYALSLDDIANNSFAIGGIAPMPLSYTNVIGGAGALAGWTMKQSDWIYPINN